jgi:hypothetical protein
MVICYDNSTLLGGFGDRIVGLISIKTISRLLNRLFFISWTKENVKSYIDYTKYDFNILQDDVAIYSYIDNQLGLKDYLMNCPDVFPNKTNIFYLNQEIAQYIYKNPRFSYRNYHQDIIREYKELYTDVLKPTDYITRVIKNLINGHNHIVGIQLRCGDKFMSTNPNELHDTKIYDKLDAILMNIKEKCDSVNEGDRANEYSVFITSDCSEVYDKAVNIWGQNKIIYLDDPIQHLDRNPVNSDIKKVFVDSILLSQYTEMLFISKHSNFGRIAALSCKHSNIYGIEGSMQDKLVLYELLSKHDIV